MDKRLLNEIEHGAKIVDHAGLVWSWETPAGKLRWHRRVQMLTENISNTDKVLELGCGTGFFSKEILKKTPNLTAIDISEDLIKIAIQNSPGADYKVVDAHKTNFLGKTYDKIVGSSVLHHLEIDKALVEIYRLLKDGGEINFTEPNMLNPQIALQKNIPWLKEKLGDSKDETAFFRWSIESKLKKLNFKKIEVIPFDFLHPSTPQSLAKDLDVLLKRVESIPFFKEIAGSIWIRAVK